MTEEYFADYYEEYFAEYYDKYFADYYVEYFAEYYEDANWCWVWQDSIGWLDSGKALLERLITIDFTAPPGTTTRCDIRTQK